MQKEPPHKISIIRLTNKKFINQVDIFPAIELEFYGDFSPFPEFGQIKLESSKGFKCVYESEIKNQKGDILLEPVLTDLPKVLYLKDEQGSQNVYIYINNKHEKIGEVVL